MYSISAVFIGLLVAVSASSSSGSSSASSSGSGLVTCSAPSSSIEVCLSSIFASMEYYLSLVEVSLDKNEVSIHNYMHHEHTLLYSEISWVSQANKIAKNVKSAVKIDKQAITDEINELNVEISVINSAYNDFYNQMEKIEDAISANIFQINNLKQEYNYIKKAKWQLYGYISAIMYEKNAVQIAINEVVKVVGQLNIQVTNIYNKISQLTKRQSWLLNWENKLYIDLEAFNKDVKRFRSVEYSLVARETALYKEQTRLNKEVTNVRKAITYLRQEYQYIVNYIKYLEVYENEILSIYSSVSTDASSFVNAYEEFTCEDNLLYYEVCSSSPAAASTGKAGAKTAANKNAKQTAANKAAANNKNANTNAAAASQTNTAAKTAANTNTNTAVVTNANTNVKTNANTNTNTAAATNTNTNAKTNTNTATNTNTNTKTNTNTATNTNTNTATNTKTKTNPLAKVAKGIAGVF